MQGALTSTTSVSIHAPYIGSDLEIAVALRVDDAFQSTLPT